MKPITTERGFKLIEFRDHYSTPCSLQESSAATTNCIWLGTRDSRMHLTQDQAKELLPFLQKFVETGKLD